MVRAQEVPVKICGIVTRGEIERQKPSDGSILHDKVDSTSNAVSFQVGRHRLVHFYARQNLRGEEVKGNKAVLVVRARYLYSIDQSVIVTFVHTSKYSILSLSRGITLHRHTRHALYDIAHCNVGSQLHSLRAHDIDDIDRFLLYLDSLGIRTSVVVGDDDDVSNACGLLLHPYIQCISSIRNLHSLESNKRTAYHWRRILGL